MTASSANIYITVCVYSNIELPEDIPVDDPEYTDENDDDENNFST